MSPYTTKGYSYKIDKTAATGYAWAYHLALLLIDTVHTASRFYIQFLRGSPDEESFWAFLGNFLELYANTNAYMPESELEKLNIENLFQLDESPLELTNKKVIKIIESFFAYNKLIHESELMQIIEEAVIVGDSGN